MGARRTRRKSRRSGCALRQAEAASVALHEVKEQGIGRGLNDLELGVRLRYEITREFAPYLGASWQNRYGGTARFARDRGEDVGGWRLVAGVRAWF